MISSLFMRFGIVFAIIGMALGIYMGVVHDFSLSPVHAHINLVGWVSMFLAGLFYKAYPQCQTRLAWAHLSLSVVGLLLMAPGVAAVTRNISWGEPMAVAGSLATFASILIFAFIVFRARLVEQHRY